MIEEKNYLLFQPDFSRDSYLVRGGVCLIKYELASSALN